jgi:pimeloyl-ACP methyl ester carboxylesterase
MKTFHALGGDPAAQRDLRRHLGPGLDDEKLERLGRLGDAVAAPRSACSPTSGTRATPWARSAAQYAGPVLLVRGEADPFVTAEVFAGGVVPRFEQPAVASIAKAGHWPHVEQPHVFAQVLRAFLARWTRPPAADAPQGWTRAFGRSRPRPSPMLSRRTSSSRPACWPGPSSAPDRSRR